MIKDYIKGISFVKKNYVVYRFIRRFYLLVTKIKKIVQGVIAFQTNKHEYMKLNKDPSFNYSICNSYPIYTDRYEEAGTLGSYFWQDLWAARLINRNKPFIHYDIGSRVDGFIGHLASFRDNVILIDIRPMKDVIPGVNFLQADATELKGVPDSSVESISALCSLEHFGLGRYGDPIDPESWKKAICSIKRVLKNGGSAYISVPIGKQHLEFDAHRVFYPRTIVEAFSPLKLIEFSCCHENSDKIEENVSLSKYENDIEKGGLRFGLFHFVKETS